MISIIICSKYSDIHQSLKDNILGSIGVECELIVIDNSTNNYSIFSAYNEGVHKAKGDIFCFMHEDILYHTQDWGRLVVEHFKNPNLGIIGVSGAHYYPKMPVTWWSSGIGSARVLQRYRQQTSLYFKNYTENNAASIPAAVVDGLWFCASKKLMRQLRFDDKIFSGFHAYDMDICMQANGKKFEIRIVFDIILEHFSMGTYDDNWIKNIFLFYNKWKSQLPAQCLKLTKQQISEANFSSAKDMLGRIIKNQNASDHTKKFWFYYLRSNPPINKRNIRYFASLCNITIRQKITKKYPKISFNNPLLNSLKYIIKNSFSLKKKPKS